MFLHIRQIYLLLTRFFKFQHPVPEIALVNFSLDPLMPGGSAGGDNCPEIGGRIESDKGVIDDPDTVIAFFLTIFENPEIISKGFASGLQAFSDFKVFVCPGVLHALLRFPSSVSNIRNIRMRFGFTTLEPRMIRVSEFPERDTAPFFGNLAAFGMMLTIPSTETPEKGHPHISNQPPRPSECALYHRFTICRTGTATTRIHKMMNDNSKYIEVPVLTVSEAARFIGVGKKVIYQLVEFDEIRAVREHGRVMIDRSSLEAFHNSGKRP
jgi:excisionase family DNA binding protein